MLNIFKLSKFYKTFYVFDFSLPLPDRSKDHPPGYHYQQVVSLYSYLLRKIFPQIFYHPEMEGQDNHNQLYNSIQLEKQVLKY